MADSKKPPEGKKSFAESLLKGDSVSEAEDPDAKKGFTKEWQPAAQAFSLRVWFKDGRRSEGLPWALYSGDGWHDGESGRPECLTLTFGTRVVQVEGFHLKRLVEQIDEGHLKSIREHDAQEVALLQSEHASAPSETKPAIVRVKVEPPFEEFVSEIRKGES